MSWHFSRALVAEYLEVSSWDGERSAQWNVTPMHGMCSSPAKTTARSRPSQSGMMYAHSTADLGAAVLTWYLEAFPAKTSALLAAALESPERNRVYGPKWLGSFARWDRATSSWRTPQCSLLAGLDEWSETWPRWGMMRTGACWALPTPALPTREKEFGFWPTPQASDSMRARMRVESFRKVHADSRGGRSYLGRILAHEEGLSQSAAFSEWLMGWPSGWTDCAPLGTDKFREWLHSHAAFFQHPHTMTVAGESNK